MASDPESENSEPTWETYYQWLEGRKPRTLFIEALDKFGQADDIHTPRHAIDLGFGDGIETLALLDAGWHVFAIDNEPAALERLRSKSKPQHETHLTLDTASFEEFDPPETDFLFAGLSLPFCRPEAFDRVWGKLAGAIRPGGRFAGQLFGIRDEWAENSWMTFLSLEQVKALFRGSFEIETLRETEEDGEASTGLKHWHVFEVIARKVAPADALHSGGYR